MVGALGLISSCGIDLDSIDFSSALGSGYKDYSAFFEIDSSKTIFSSLQFIDHRPDSMTMIGNIYYDSVLVIDQYSFEFGKIGDGDSLSITIDIIVDSDTIDFRNLGNKNLKYYYNLDLDTAYNYQICHKLLVDCNKNPQFSEQCYQGWYELQEYTEIYFNN